MKTLLYLLGVGEFKKQKRKGTLSPIFHHPFLDEMYTQFWSGLHNWAGVSVTVGEGSLWLCNDVVGTKEYWNDIMHKYVYFGHILCCLWK